MTIHLIPNFHFDLTWHKDVATFMALSSRIFCEALDLLDADPEFRYTIDHVAFIEWFLEHQPDEAARVRSHVDSGRLELVGGMVSMMDCDVPDGEVFARQLLYGQRWLEHNLGKRAMVGWLIDNYGYTPQLPQLLTGAGIDGLEICLWWAPSTYLADRLPCTEFRWRGLDGTEVVTHVALPNYTGPRFPGHHAYDDPPAPFDPAQEQALAEQGLQAWLDQVSHKATGADLLAHVGGDFRHPEPHLTGYVKGWNEKPGHPPAHVTVPGDFFAAIAARRDTLPAFEGEISPPMHTVVKSMAQVSELAQSVQHVRPEGVGRFGEGYAEAKVERKQLDRAVHLALREAEQAATWARLLGAPSQTAEIARLYHPILTYGHHDPFIGCVVHADYERIIAQLRATLQRAEALRDAALGQVGQLTDTCPPPDVSGSPVQVFNSLTWQQTRCAQVRLPSKPGAALRVIDAAGANVACQVVEEPGGTDLLFEANPPGCGHAVYFIGTEAEPPDVSVPVVGPSAARDVAEPGPRPPSQTSSGIVLENGRFSLAFSSSGALLSASARRSGRELLGAAGAEFILEEDLGCFCHIDPTGVAWRQSDNPLARIEVIEEGPVRWRIAIENESKGVHYRQTVSLYGRQPWIEFRTTMDIRSGEDLRARVRFDLPAAPDEIWAETAFGAVRREAELAHAVNWVDCAWPGQGLALLNRGLTSYEVAGNSLYLTLWRGLSQFNECYGCLQRGQRLPLIEHGRREFRYALLPHAGDWRQAGAVRWGQAFNTDLKAVAVETHQGLVPARYAWLSAAPENVVIAAVKEAEAGAALVVRLYESSGAATQAALRAPADFREACETNLLEDDRRWMSLSDREVGLVFRPFEVKTLMLRR